MYVCDRKIDLGRSSVKVAENRELPFTGDQLRVRREHRINEPIPFRRGSQGDYVVRTPAQPPKREILSFAHMSDDVTFIRVKPSEFQEFRFALRRIAGSSFGDIYAAIGAPGIAYKFLKPDGFDDATVMTDFDPRIDPEREAEAPGEFSRKRSDDGDEQSEGSLNVSSSSGESMERSDNRRRRVKVINLSKIQGREDDDDEDEQDVSDGYNWSRNTYIPAEVFNWLAVTAAGDHVIKTGYGDISCKKNINTIRTQNEALYSPHDANARRFYEHFPFKHWSAFYISPRGGIYIKNTLMDSSLAHILEDRLGTSAQFQIWDMLFKKTNPRAADNVLDVQIQMAAALHFLHANNIVHLDLKPEQFLVRVANDHSRVEVKLTDFGTCVVFDNALLAPFLKPGYALKCVKDTGDLRGNYIYTAPEYLAGHRIADYGDDPAKCGKEAPADMKAIDMWGLGVMLYQFKYEGNPLPAMEFPINTDIDWVNKSIRDGHMDEDGKTETLRAAAVLRAIVAYFEPIPDDLVVSTAYLPRALKPGESLAVFPLANFVKNELNEDAMDEFMGKLNRERIRYGERAFSPKSVDPFLARLINYDPERRMSAKEAVQFLAAKKEAFGAE